MTIPSEPPRDADSLGAEGADRTIEAATKARQAAEDETWALRALIAEAEDGYIGPEATMAFLQEMIARADSAC